LAEWLRKESVENITTDGCYDLIASVCYGFRCPDSTHTQKDFSMKKMDIIGGSVLLFFGLGIFLKSLTYPIGSLRQPDGGMFPLLASIILILISAVLILQAFLNKTEEGLSKSFFPAKEAPKRIFLGFLALVGFRCLLPLIGFACSTFLFVFFMAKYLGNYSWKVSLLFSILTVLAAYYLFQVWLKIPMPRLMIGG
jgi:putative tricarboxylic transport membrane protein